MGNINVKHKHNYANFVPDQKSEDENKAAADTPSLPWLAEVGFVLE